MNFVAKWIMVMVSLLVPFIQAEWFELNGHRYFLSLRVSGTSKLNYSSAEQYCVSNQAKLASVLDKEEADFIYTSSQLDKEHIEYSWIGLQYSGSIVKECNTCDECDKQNNLNTSHNCTLCYTCRKKWKWSDGSAMSWTNWHPQQPNENVKCGQIQINEAGKWYDRACAEKSSFICKKADMPPTTTTVSTSPSTAPIGKATSTTPSSHSNTTSDTGKSVENMDSSNIGIVAGVVVAVLVAVIVSLVVIGLIIKRKRDKKMQDPQKRKKLDHTTSYENVGDMYSYAYANPASEDIQIQENGTEYAEFGEQQDTSYADINDNKAQVTGNTNVHNSTETVYTNTAPDGVTALDNVSALYAVPDKTNKQKYNNKPKPEKPKRKKKPVKVQEDIPDSKIDIEAMYAQPMKKKK